MSEKHVHIHLPPGGGSYQINISGDEVTTTILDPAEEPAEGAQADVESMLRRFESYDHTSGARAVHDHLVAKGWQPHLPQARTDGQPTGAYIRFTYEGSGRRVTAYLNSAALFVQGAYEKPIFKAIKGADVRSNDVHIFHTEARGGSVDGVIVAADRLEHFADGGAVATA